jgi:hypothetical protein
LRPDCPADLEAICLCCLHKLPASRYATAAALAEDLRRFRAGRPTKAQSPSRSISWSVRQRVVLGGVLVLSALLGGWAVLRGISGPSPAALSSTPAEKEALAREASQILERRCASCHGNVKPKKGLNVLDHATLLDQARRKRALIPFKPDESNLLYRIEEGSMPPEEAGGMLPLEEMELVRRWIAAGAPEPMLGR